MGRRPTTVRLSTTGRFLVANSRLRLQVPLSFIGSFMALSGLMLYAQGTSGNISGQVLDPSGLSIPGVRVAAINLATNITTTATSTEAGNYNLVVPPGAY